MMINALKTNFCKINVFFANRGKTYAFLYKKVVGVRMESAFPEKDDVACWGNLPLCGEVTLSRHKK